MQTAVEHLKIGGVLSVVGKTEKTFRSNNFAYTGEKNGVHVTLLENNYINSFHPNTYEVTLVYLIRQRAELTIYTDRQVLGLFPQTVWDKVFRDAGFTMRKRTLGGVCMLSLRYKEIKNESGSVHQLSQAGCLCFH